MKNFIYRLPLTKEVTPQDIYVPENREEPLTIPSGWEEVAFRPPVEGDMFLVNNSIGPRKVYKYGIGEFWSSPQTPRLILKKTNEVIDDRKPVVITVGDIYEKDVVIPEGWKFQRFGLPVAGDYYLNKTDPRMREYWDKFMGSHDSPRIIVTKA